MLKYKIKIRIVKENYHLPFGNHPQDELEVKNQDFTIFYFVVFVKNIERLLCGIYFSSFTNLKLVERLLRLKYEQNSCHKGLNI
jgi:hypothetical protein